MQVTAGERGIFGRSSKTQWQLVIPLGAAQGCNFGKKCPVLGSTVVVTLVLQTGLSPALVLASSVGVKYITNGSNMAKESAADLVPRLPFLKFGMEGLGWKNP